MWFVQFILPMFCFGAFVVALVVFFYRVSCLDAAKERELEQIQQEMERLRARMDEQYADLTLMLNQERKERERNRRV